MCLLGQRKAVSALKKIINKLFNSSKMCHPLFISTFSRACLLRSKVIDKLRMFTLDEMRGDGALPVFWPISTHVQSTTKLRLQYDKWSDLVGRHQTEYSKWELATASDTSLKSHGVIEDSWVAVFWDCVTTGRGSTLFSNKTPCASPSFRRTYSWELAAGGFLSLCRKTPGWNMEEWSAKILCFLNQAVPRPVALAVRAATKSPWDGQSPIHWSCGD